MIYYKFMKIRIKNINLVSEIRISLNLTKLFHKQMLILLMNFKIKNNLKKLSLAKIIKKRLKKI